MKNNSYIQIFAAHRGAGRKVILAALLAATTGSMMSQSLKFDSAEFTVYQKTAFSIQVPDYLVEVTDMSEQADLQMKNVFNETYLLIVAEPKATAVSLPALQHKFETNLAAHQGLVMARKDLRIDGRRAFQLDVVWQVQGNDLAYLVTFVDAPDVIYKIYFWTLGTQRNLLQDFRKSVSTFAINQFQARR